MSAGKPTPLGGAKPLLAGGALSLPFAPFQSFARTFAPGTTTFSAPFAGLWKFVLWGAGGTSGDGEASGGGAYCEITKKLGVNETVTVVCGGFQQLNGAGDLSGVTFRDGRQAVAGGGAHGSGGGVAAGGVATGGDVNINGSPSSGSNGGNAGGSTLFPGGSGTTVNGIAPGGGSGKNAGPGTDVFVGGGGLVLVFSVVA